MLSHNIPQLLQERKEKAESSTKGFILWWTGAISIVASVCIAANFLFS